MAHAGLRNSSFRLTLKATWLALALALAARLTSVPPGAIHAALAVAGTLALLTLVFAIGALSMAPGQPILVRLFRPGPSHAREVLHVLSFFTFADPGEVSWHAVEQSRERRRPSVSGSLGLYVALVIPSALLSDWLIHRGGRLTLTCLFYLAPYVLIRALEERARRQPAARRP